MFFNDFILNGEAHGDVAGAMAMARFDPGLLRPFKDDRGRQCVTVNTGRTKVVNGQVQPIYEKRTLQELAHAGYDVPIANATSLRKDEWIRFDQAVIKEARARLRAWSDLQSAASYGGFDGMAKMTLEYEAMSDPGEAVVDMDGMSEGRGDSPLYKLRSIPLPITHSDFYLSKRLLTVSRNTGMPLDTSMAEAAGRRVAETIEKTLIGETTGMTYGTNSSEHDGSSKVYGYTNYTDRVTKTDLTTPTGSNPDSTVADVLAMRSLLYAQNFFGPFMVYHSKDWDQYLDNDYYALTTSGATAPTRTLRERLRAIEGIQDVRRLDYLDDTYTLIMVQMTADVVRAINGMGITTVQWESQGGMRVNFKVMAIQVPQIRSDYDGRCGICHGTTA